MLVLTRADVEAAIDLPSLVDSVGAAMADLSAGSASMPARVAASVEALDAMLAVMPAYLPSASALTTKLVTLFPHNDDRPTHQAVICCFDATNGTPVAVMDGTYITAMRTAAGCALATRLLARPDSTVVAVIGTGVQARAHVAAFAATGQAERFLLSGRDGDEVAELAAALTDQHGVPVEPAPSIPAAIGRADVVCATTHAATPVVTRDALRPGTHVNSVGYNAGGAGEVDLDVVRDAVLVVESRAAALAPPPSGAIELRRAIEAGVVGPDHIRAELGELVAGTARGRTGPDDLTLYKSVGVAVQDAAAAAHVLAVAHDRGLGRDLAM